MADARILTILPVVIVMLGCVQTLAPPPPKLLKPPLSLADVLVNIKQATEAGLILQDDFYTDDNLRSVFGGKIVRPGGRVSGFPAWSEPVRHGTSEYESLELRIVKSSGADGRPAAVIYFGTQTRTDLDFAAVEKLLGTSWEPYTPAPNPHSPVSEPATRPHGNAQIIYTLGKRDLSRTLWIKFGPDATFEYARALANRPGN